MSKFVILAIINLPIVLFGSISALTGYKTGRLSKNRCRAELGFWLITGLGLVSAQPFYNALIANRLTDSTPMSLFDIVLLTLLLLSLQFIVRANEKIASLNRRFSLLHEELAVLKSTKKD